MDLIGRTVSHYKIIEEIGSGGMGVVYKAQDTSLDRLVALKFLPPTMSGDAASRQRFVQEAKAASALDHPQICTVHEIGETDDGHTFIVMPWYDGEPLSAVAARGVTVGEAVGLVRQAALGLGKAHEKGIVHRDVKSQNILVTRDGHVKVLDFGLAKLAGKERLTRSGAVLGTIGYLSPEQARGEAVDQRADIFSLGVVLYELLTGDRPFAHEHDAAVLYAVVNEDPARPGTLRPAISPALDNVVMRALHKDSQLRYQSMDEFIADLDRAISGERPAAPHVRRSRRAVAILVIVVAAAVAWWQFGDRKPSMTVRGKSIGVMYFTNLSADPALDWMQNGIVELLNTALSRSPDLSVLDSQRMASIVRDLGGDPTGRFDALAAEVARVAGVGTMLVGNIIKSGSTIRLQVKLIDVENGEILHSDFVDGTAEDDIFAMVAALTARLQTYLEIRSVAETVDETWIRDISTSSVDAYRDYIRGYGLFLRSEHVRARELFERAIAADSNFVMAYVELVGACFNLEDYACIGEAYEHARRLRSRAPRKEQLSIDLIGAIINDQYEQQIAASRELLTIVPGAHFWTYTLGRGYYMSNRLEQALDIWRPLISDRWDWEWTYIYASDACRQLKRYDEAISILDVALDATPPSSTESLSHFHRYRGRALAEKGDYDNAIAEFERARTHSTVYPLIYKYDLAFLNEQQGNTDDAIRYLNEYLDEDTVGYYIVKARDQLERLQK